METQVSLVHIPGDSIQSASDITDVQNVADFLRSIGDSAYAALPEKKQVSKPILETPFVTFVNKLLSTETGKITTNGGAVEWTGFPILTLMAQGLWPIMMKIAEKQDMHLGTETNILKQIAPKAEQMLNIGIMLCYGSAENAAQEFMRYITESLQSVNTKPRSLAAVVQKPVAKFFASMLKAIAPTREKLLSKLAKLNRDNHVSSVFSYVPGHKNQAGLPSIDSLYHLGKNMDGRTRFTEGYTFNFHNLCLIGDALMAYEMAIRVAKKLPFRLSDISDQETMGRIEKIHVVDEWLVTQMILAATNAPITAGSVGTENYLKAVSECQSLTEDKIIAKTLARFKKRGSPISAWTAEELYWLETMMHDHSAFIFQELDPTGIHHSVLTHYNFDAAVTEKATMPHSQVLALAKTKEPLRSKLLADAQAIADISMSLDWKRVLIDDIHELVQAAIIPPEDIAKGMLKMQNYDTALGKMWQDACKELKAGRNIEYATPAAIEILTKHGLLKPKKEPKVTYREDPTLIPPGEKANYLKKFLQELQKDEGYNSASVEHVMQIAKSEATFARNFFSQPDVREYCFIFFLSTLTSKQERRSFGISDLEFQTFQLLVGKKLWLKFLLSVEVLFRNDEYTSINKDGSGTSTEGPMPPWQKLEEYKDECQRPSQSCTYSPKQISLLLKTSEFSEKSIFCWYHETDPNLEANLKKYLKARDRYFRIVGKK
jgi:hypothetical protein